MLSSHLQDVLTLHCYVRSWSLMFGLLEVRCWRLNMVTEAWLNLHILDNLLYIHTLLLQHLFFLTDKEPKQLPFTHLHNGGKAAMQGDIILNGNSLQFY